MGLQAYRTLIGAAEIVWPCCYILVGADSHEMFPVLPGPSAAKYVLMIEGGKNKKNLTKPPKPTYTRLYKT